MNLPSLLLLFLLLLAVVLALRALWKHRGTGGCSGCSGCRDPHGTCPFRCRGQTGKKPFCHPDSLAQVKQVPEKQEDRP